MKSLLKEVKADERLGAIGPRELVYGGRLLTGLGQFSSEIEKAGLSKDRWEKYQERLRALGLAMIVNGGAEVEFRVDPGTIWNGDSYKGYVYKAMQPALLVDSLDNYWLSGNDRAAHRGYCVSKKLKGNWYLYLSVN